MLATLGITRGGGALTGIRGLFLSATLLAATSAALWAGGTATGASFTVDSTVDAVDAAPGDGACADATGACTLRAAVQETNALPGPDTITLAFETYQLTIAGADEDLSATGDLDIRDDATIVGGVVVNGTTEPATTIDAGRLDRVADIIGPTSVEMSGLIIRNGDVTSAALTVGGGHSEFFRHAHGYRQYLDQQRVDRRGCAIERWPPLPGERHHP
jgi:CSLREA domain-containing protein